MLQQGQVIEGYIEHIKDTLKSVLQDKDYIGKLEIEVNIKDGAITNMNIAPRKWVKIN